MSADFYYGFDNGKKRSIIDDHLDDANSDFIISFASDLDELRANRQDRSELCLSVISSSFMETGRLSMSRSSPPRAGGAA